MVTAARKKWREANRQRTREYSRRFRATHIELHRQQNKEYQRKKLGVPEPTREAPTLCELCSRPPSEKRALAADHDHETREFRGWLCHRCNTALGLLGDTLAAVKAALIYLERV